MLCRNVGGLDRALRLVLGAVLLPVGVVLLAGGHPYGAGVTVVAGFVLASGLLGFCPPYVVLGISTARPKPPPPSGATPARGQAR
jgi:hypothetical protein